MDSIAARQMGVLTAAMERASGGQPYQKSTRSEPEQVKPTKPPPSGRWPDANQHTKKVVLPKSGKSKKAALSAAGIDIRRANEAEALARSPVAQGPETAPFL